MKWFKTLRVRFALWIAGLFIAVLVSFGAFVYIRLARELADAVDDSLRLNAVQAMAAVNIENGQFNLSDNLLGSGDIAGPRERGLTIRVLDLTGQVIQAFGPYQALPITSTSLADAQAGRATFTTLAEPAEHDLVRFYTVPIVENDQRVGFLQVAQSLDPVQDTLHHLRNVLLIGGPLVIVVAALSGYFLAARALAPIDHITRTARRISAEDLSARLRLPVTDDEVGRLAATFDEMLAHLEESFRREHQFTTSASHELRTPLAAMQAILGMIREKPRQPEEYEQALADLAEETDRLRTLTEDLLYLARGGQSQPLPREPIDLSTLLCDVTDSLRPLAEAKGLTLVCTAPSGLSLIGDGDGLIRLFVNLLDNAIKYTERGGVTVCAERGINHTLAVTVADTGSGIPAEHSPRIFDQFYRVDTSRTMSGVGLGLAIAREVARAHGGDIEVSSTVGQGTTFTVGLAAEQ